MAEPLRAFESLVSFPADGETSLWPFSFAGGYIDASHIKVVVQALDGSVSVPPYELETASSVRIAPAITAGSVITIFRQTPTNEPMVDFADRAQVTEASLDLLAKQAIMSAAEAKDWGQFLNGSIPTSAALVLAAAQASADAAEDFLAQASDQYTLVLAAVADANAAAAAAASSASGASASVASLTASLAASGGANMVGFLPSGAGAVASSLQARGRKFPIPSDYSTNAAYVAAVQALATNQNFAQNGAVIYRMPDRLFIGDAIQNDGAFPNVLQDWTTVWQIAAGLGNGSLSNATLGVLTTTSPASRIGALFAAQSKYASASTASSIGVFGFALNNHATFTTDVWAGYFEAHKDSGEGCRGIEIDVRIKTGVAEINPTPAQQTTSSCLQLAAGADLNAVGTQNVGAAIQVKDNPAKFRKGFVFGKDSLEGTDGTSGFGTAMAMAAFHGLEWFNNANAVVGRVSAQTATGGGELRFTSTGALVLGQNFLSVARFTDVALAVNSFSLTAAATTLTPSISVTGADTDIDFRILPKGAGLLRWGAFTATGDVAIVGYVRMKTDDNTVRRVAIVSGV